MERLPEILPTLPARSLNHVEFTSFEEVNAEPGKKYFKAGSKEDPWMIVVAKKEGEWRGRAIAVKHRQVASNRVPVTVKTEQGDVGFLNIHLPRRYTLNETGNQTAEWRDMRVMKPKLVVMGDFSETFTCRGLHTPQPEFQSCCSGWRSSAWRRRRNKSTRHPTTPSTRNCNPADSTTSSPGAPCQFNEGGSGNSDTLFAVTTTGSSSTSSEGSRHIGRQNKGTICDMDRDSSKHPRKLRTLSKQSQSPIATTRGYKESPLLKRMRRQALRARPGPEASMMWKQVWKQRGNEKNQWQRDTLQAVL